VGKQGEDRGKQGEAIYLSIDLVLEIIYNGLVLPFLFVIGVSLVLEGFEVIFYLILCYFEKAHFLFG